MFIRILTADLKPGQGPRYAEVIDRKVIPLMRTFPGFRDEISGCSPDGKKALGISFWETSEYSEVYKREGYPRVLEAMAPFIKGEPVVVGYDVTTSTAHHIVTQTVGV